MYNSEFLTHASKETLKKDLSKGTLKKGTNKKGPLKRDLIYKKEFLRDTSKRVSETYGVATISRLLKIIRLFCTLSSLLQGSLKRDL